MEELLALRTALEEHRYADAFAILGELEEMSKDDKIEKIYSYMVVLLVHLIKQQAEQRTTRSWELSIHESVKKIQRINKRRKSGGYYLTEAELRENLTEAYGSALKIAALEIFGGQYTEEQLANKINKENIEKIAFELILGSQL